MRPVRQNPMGESDVRRDPFTRITRSQILRAVLLGLIYGLLAALGIFAAMYWAAN